MADTRYNNAEYSTYSTLETLPQVSSLPARPQWLLTGKQGFVPRYEGAAAPEVVHGPEKVLYAANPMVPYGYDQSKILAYSNDAPEALPTQSGSPKRAWWKRKRVLIPAVILIIGLIAGLVGGIVGGLLSRRASGNTAASSAVAPTATSTPSSPDGSGSGGNSSDTSSSGSSSSDPKTDAAVSPLAESQLAALNWTDSSDIQRRVVFYQYNGSLFYNQWYGSNKSWSTFNLSDSYQRNNGASLDAKSGTPLAVSAPSKQDVDYLDVNDSGSHFQVVLYYIDTDGYVRNVVSSQQSLYTWTSGDLANMKYQAHAKSQLAATAFYCPRDTASWVCNDDPVFLYQDVDQAVRKSLGPTTSVPDTLDQSWPGSTLAVIPFASSSGKNVTDISELRMFYYLNKNMRMKYQNEEGYLDCMAAHSLSI